jgi:hypothetical protein
MAIVCNKEDFRNFAESELSISSFFRKLEMNKNPDHPVNPVQRF